MPKKAHLGPKLNSRIFLSTRVILLCSNAIMVHLMKNRVVIMGHAAATKLGGLKTQIFIKVFFMAGLSWPGHSTLLMVFGFWRT